MDFRFIAGAGLLLAGVANLAYVNQELGPRLFGVRAPAAAQRTAREVTPVLRAAPPRVALLAGAKRRAAAGAKPANGPKPTLGATKRRPVATKRAPVATKRAPASTRADRGQSRLPAPLTVRFAQTGTAALFGKATARLESVVIALHAAAAGVRVRLVGHTDTRGDAANNQRLGLLRAQAARRYLVRRGVTRERITVESRGEQRPLVGRTARQSWRLSRRIEITFYTVR